MYSCLFAAGVTITMFTKPLFLRKLKTHAQKVASDQKKSTGKDKDEAFVGKAW